MMNVASVTPRNDMPHRRASTAETMVTCTQGSTSQAREQRQGLKEPVQQW